MRDFQTTVILRECGERTAGRTFESLCKIFPKFCVHRITEKPFSAALIKSYQLGLSEGRKYTLCIDADVMVNEAGLMELIDIMDTKPTNVFEMQGLVYDNLFQIFRPAGNHLYRTELLDEALSIVDESKHILRPESHVLGLMAKRGLPWLQSKLFIGSHDYGQYHNDVYRKAFLGVIKHDQFMGYLKQLWRALSQHGLTDFDVAYSALNDAKGFKGEVRVDKNFLSGRSQRFQNKYDASYDDDINKQVNLAQSLLSKDVLKTREHIQSHFDSAMFKSKGAVLRRILASQSVSKVINVKRSIRR